jgi:hypothetical protein
VLQDLNKSITNPNTMSTHRQVNESYLLFLSKFNITAFQMVAVVTDTPYEHMAAYYVLSSIPAALT